MSKLKVIGLTGMICDNPGGLSVPIYQSGDKLFSGYYEERKVWDEGYSDFKKLIKDGMGIPFKPETINKKINELNNMPDENSLGNSLIYFPAKILFLKKDIQDLLENNLNINSLVLKNEGKILYLDDELNKTAPKMTNGWNIAKNYNFYFLDREGLLKTIPKIREECKQVLLKKLQSRLDLEEILNIPKKDKKNIKKGDTKKIRNLYLDYLPNLVSGKDDELFQLAQTMSAFSWDFNSEFDANNYLVMMVLLSPKRDNFPGLLHFILSSFQKSKRK
ncbi:MAG: hypothetical protein PHF86_05650 [Candidatus Nanoarchaeia archaeon]|nr:hypothetical protein [Candidatus Nanoarchaeia archaeon]